MFLSFGKTYKVTYICGDCVCLLYEKGKYPDHTLVIQSVQLMDNILSQQKDNVALIDRVISKENELFDNKEDAIRFIRDVLEPALVAYRLRRLR